MLDQIIFQNVSPLCSVGGLQQCAAMMVVAGKKFFLQQPQLQPSPAVEQLFGQTRPRGPPAPENL